MEPTIQYTTAVVPHFLVKCDRREAVRACLRGSPKKGVADENLRLVGIKNYLSPVRLCPFGFLSVPGGRAVWLFTVAILLVALHVAGDVFPSMNGCIIASFSLLGISTHHHPTHHSYPNCCVPTGPSAGEGCVTMFSTRRGTGLPKRCRWHHL